MLHQAINAIRKRFVFRGFRFATVGFAAVSFFMQIMLYAPNDVLARNGGDAIRPGVVLATDMHLFGDPSTALSGAALLRATPNHISATIHATGLDPNAAYTVWAVVFSRPEHCTAGTDPRPDVMCGSPDLSLTPNTAEASAFHVGGFLTTSDGTAQVDVTLDSGPPAAGNGCPVGHWWDQ